MSKKLIPSLGAGAFAMFAVVGCDQGDEVLGYPAAAVTTTTVSFQNGTNGYTGNDDATLSANNATTNYGTATTLLADGDDPSGTGLDKSFVARWNVSSIPASATVTGVTMTFYVSNASAAAYAIRPLLRAFTESQVTWNLAATGASWATAGATGATGASDRGAVVGTLLKTSTGSVTVTLDSAGVALVQSWVSGSAANHGFVFESSTNTDGLDVASSENSTVSRRPRLTVTYTTGNAGDAGATADAGNPTDAGSDAGNPADAGGGTGVVMVGAGDIASCSVNFDSLTANLLDTIPGTIFAPGDLTYESGTAAEFTNCFHPTWGRHKSRIRPAPGNHEYVTSGASGYYNYFGSAAGDPSKGYYSYDEGAWHVVVLNSNCSNISGGCAAGGAQEAWLRADLAANPRACTLAYWHHPRYSSGSHGNNPSVAPLWQALMDHGADLVIEGHDHDYERFVPMDANGNPSANGITSIVVGTGGKDLRAFSGSAPSYTAVRNANSYGVLKLTLNATSAQYEFVPAAGYTFRDSGTIVCR